MRMRVLPMVRHGAGWCSVASASRFPRLAPSMPPFRNGLLLCTIPILLVPAAQAQSHSCELLKQTLAARIPPEIRGYTMDDVPAKTPVPAGGKVIGTCEGGARKVIYRRFGGPPLSVDGAAVSGPAALPASAPTSKPAPVAAPAPAPALAQKQAPKATAEPAAPAKPVAPPAASAVPAAPKPATTLAASAPAPHPPLAPVVASAPALIPEMKPVVMEKPARPPAAAAPRVTAPADDGPSFIDAYGPWLWLLLALPLGGLAWGWISHRMAYDSAGLPRGPRL